MKTGLRSLRRKDGAAAIEFALIAPLFFSSALAIGER